MILISFSRPCGIIVWPWILNTIFVSCFRIRCNNMWVDFSSVCGECFAPPLEDIQHTYALKLKRRKIAVNIRNNWEPLFCRRDYSQLLGRILLLWSCMPEKEIFTYTSMPFSFISEKQSKDKTECFHEDFPPNVYMNPILAVLDEDIEHYSCHFYDPDITG